MNFSDAVLNLVAVRLATLVAAGLLLHALPDHPQAAPLIAEMASPDRCDHAFCRIEAQEDVLIRDMLLHD